MAASITVLAVVQSRPVDNRALSEEFSLISVK